MSLETKQGSHARDYGSGALAVLVVSIGIAAVVYGVNMIPFNVFNFPTWIFCPLGVYTLIYALVARKDSVYYLVWGSVMLVVGVVSASYNVISPFVVLGILLIIIAVIGMVAHWRRKE